MATAAGWRFSRVLISHLQDAADRCRPAHRRPWAGTACRPAPPPGTSGRPGQPLGTVDVDPAVGLGVGDVHAVLAHAPGERQLLLLLLRAEFGWLATVGLVLPAGLVCRLELGGVRVDPLRELLGHAPGRVDLGVGHVDAVLAHAPAVCQRPLSGVAAAARASGAGGLAAAEAGHPVAPVTTTTTTTAGRDGQRQSQQPGHQPHPDARHRRPPPWPVARQPPPPPGAARGPLGGCLLGAHLPPPPLLCCLAPLG